VAPSDASEAAEPALRWTAHELGTTWDGTPQEQADVRDDLDEAVAWATTNGRELLMGEFGAYEAADMDSRVRWTDFVAREAEQRDIAWTYWEFCAGFGAYDRNQQAWRQELLEALIPP
jgi:endoglucanase